MNDKVKEILDNIKNKYDGYLVCDIVSGDDLKLLLDYINRLQSNWNSLREQIIKRLDRYDRLVSKEEGIEIETLMWVRDKMNELEKSDIIERKIK